MYGQQEIVKDLIAARLNGGGDIRFEVDAVTLADLGTDRPRITFVQDGAQHTLDCDFVVGADGFHGISRSYVPELTAYERHYRFAWLGILAEAPPSSHELIYARHENGFALHSMRTPSITRMYLQVPAEEDIADWPDERIWAELHTRLTTDDGFALTAARASAHPAYLPSEPEKSRRPVRGHARSVGIQRQPTLTWPQRGPKLARK